MSQHIYVYSPSGAVRDKAAFRRGVKRLQAMGHEVEIDRDALATDTRFAGDDATRLAAIHRAAASGADVALTSRGGYGLTRLLPHIDYKAVATSAQRGMHWVGFSDFTALALAAYAKARAVTWAGPSLCADLGVPGEPDDIMLACLDDLLVGQGEGAGWRQLPVKTDAAGIKAAAPQETAIDKNRRASKNIAIGAYETCAPADFAIDNAVLWGGNLSLVVALLGTPYFPKIEGGVLFLEDVGEHPYRIERMLTQLLHAGVLGQQKAIVLGQFTGYELTAHDRGYKLANVVAWLRRQTRVPVLTNLPMGHVATKVLLPVGRPVELAVQGRDALLFWGHGTHD